MASSELPLLGAGGWALKTREEIVYMQMRGVVAPSEHLRPHAMQRRHAVVGSLGLPDRLLGGGDVSEAGISP